MVITVTNSDETPPTFLSEKLVEIPENSDSVIYVAKVDEPASFSLSMNGRDDNKFNITEGGNVTFTDSPDFEAPTDSDLDNQYDIEIIAEDTTGNTSLFEVGIRVTDITETPTVVVPLEDLVFLSGFDTTTIKLIDFFSDPNNDQLSFRATSSNESVITTHVSGDVLTLLEQGAGNASVTVTADDGKGGIVSDEFSVTVAQILSLRPDNFKELLLFPNPLTSNKAYLSLGEEITGSIRVLDLKGHKLYETRINGNSLTLDFADYKTGVYLIYIEADNQRKTLLKIAKK